MGGNDRNTKLSEVVFEEALKETKAKYEPYWKISWNFLIKNRNKSGILSA